FVLSLFHGDFQPVRLCRRLSQFFQPIPVEHIPLFLPLVLCDNWPAVGRLQQRFHPDVQCRKLLERFLQPIRPEWPGLGVSNCVIIEPTLLWTSRIHQPGDKPSQDDGESDTDHGSLLSAALADRWPGGSTGTLSVLDYAISRKPHDSR